jgi:hypothetical protein
LQDLLRAAEKALAAGLGDWHLQSIQDISPEFEQHVLMGALGPETLKHKHKLPEPQILHIYGLLHRHCTGFQQEVHAALTGAEHREQLLAGIWTAFAQLWDECVQVRLFCCQFSRLTPRHALKQRQCYSHEQLTQQVAAKAGSQSAREEGCSRR